MTEGNVPPPPPPSEPTPASSLPYQPVGGSGYPGPYTGAPPSKDDTTMGLLAHLLGILLGFLGPLVIWLIKKEQSPFVDDQGKEALNFQLTLLIGYLVSAAATVICIGPVIAMGISVVAIIFGIMAAVASNKGEAYRYPVNIRFIK